MPYIKQEDRDFLKDVSDKIVAELKPLSNDDLVGELNYVISKICWGLADPPRYSRLNAIIAVLEAAKLEMYRRKVAPYEDIKIVENGDI
jgi:hypothetical protein